MYPVEVIPGISYLLWFILGPDKCTLFGKYSRVRNDEDGGGMGGEDSR